MPQQELHGSLQVGVCQRGFLPHMRPVARPEVIRHPYCDMHPQLWHRPKATAPILDELFCRPSLASLDLRMFTGEHEKAPRSMYVLIVPAVAPKPPESKRLTSITLAPRRPQAISDVGSGLAAELAPDCQNPLPASVFSILKGASTFRFAQCFNKGTGYCAPL